MDTQLKAEILPDSPEQKALVKEMKRVELQLQNLDRKTLKNKNENVAQHQPASPRWSRITPTFKCLTQPWVSAKRRGAVVTACRGSIHDPIRAISRRAFRTPLFFIIDHLLYIPKYVSQPFSGSLRPSVTYSFCMSTFAASPITIAVTEKQKMICGFEPHSFLSFELVSYFVAQLGYQLDPYSVVDLSIWS
ncbi:uncharacterized protein LOC6596323 [Drosophila persimilis]|uniref:uncharacterized protein LOC6596323 n=1 Tax=Drosophila persimilis TaxID=7234 RepID=UPI000F075801|nr:uncharacterized protein LOC6596323 [Drosophila persimilis]